MGEPADKVEFASAAWVDAARVVLQDLVAEHCDGDAKLSVCEVFSGAPASVAASGTAAWHFYIDGKSVLVGCGEVDDADVTIRADYAAALPGARLIYTPEVLAQMQSQPPPDPPPQIEGDPSTFPAWLVELHNKMAVITA
jgi:hypothetical protein